MYLFLRRITQSLVQSPFRKSAASVFLNRDSDFSIVNKSLCDTKIPEQPSKEEFQDVKLVSKRYLKRKQQERIQQQAQIVENTTSQVGELGKYVPQIATARGHALEKMLEGAKSEDNLVGTDDPSSEFPSDQEKYMNWKRQQKRHSFRPRVNPEDTSIVLFPGQGSQFVGMGRDLLEYPNVAEMYEQASDILRFDLLNLCINGPGVELDKTVHCQVAVFVTSLAAVERMRAENPQAIDNCVGVAGFSVGEYAALVFTGALSFEDALMVLKVRAEAMQAASEAVPSGMMTVFCGAGSKLGFGMLAAREFCRQKLSIDDPVCSVANYLCPEIKVVAGHVEALDFLRDNASEFKLKRLKRLPVSGAFHTSIMNSAVKPVTTALNKIDIRRPLISVHGNVGGTTYKNSKMICQLLGEQIHKPIKWEQTMHIMYSRDKGEVFPKTYEAGPGQQLGIILKQVNALAYKQYRDVKVG